MIIGRDQIIKVKIEQNIKITDRDRKREENIFTLIQIPGKRNIIYRIIWKITFIL